MTCEYRQDDAKGIAEIIVDGRVTEADFDRIAARIAAFIGDRGRIRILEIVRSFDGFELAAIPKGVMFDIKHMRDFSHCAMVTDSGWIGPFTRAMAPFFNVDIRVFSLDEEAAARGWLEAAD